MSTFTITEHLAQLPRMGFSTRILTSGQGRPLVLLHGNPDNADEWRGLMASIGDGFRCIAPDLPGYGKSPEPPPAFRYTAEDQCRFLDSVLESCGVSEPVLLVVHDIGGMMGVPWAAANLERIAGVIITNTVAFEGFEWFGIVRRWGGDSALGRLRARLVMALLGVRQGALFKKVFRAQNPQLSEAELDRITGSFAVNPAARNASLRQFREVLNGDFFRGFDAMNERISATVPTQVLWGDGDPYVATRFSRRFGSAPVTVLPGVGHWVPQVATARLAEAIRNVAGRASRP